MRQPFKSLLTNVCINDCGYCVNQVGRDCPRSSFKPEELAGTFAEMVQKHKVTASFYPPELPAILLLQCSP